MGGDVTSFSYLPLWHADSDPDWAIDTPPSLTIPTPVEFGGWNTPMNPRVGVQQGKELVFEGKSVDVNSFSRAFVSLR
jgi:hypothetical protein